MATRLEDLPIYRKANEFCDAVTATLDRPAFRRNSRLANQILDATDSVLANMSEGFEQPTDIAFARYLYISKGSVAEVLTRLRASRRRRCVSQGELTPLADQGEALGRMLGGFIKYLKRSGFRDRGRGTGP